MYQTADEANTSPVVEELLEVAHSGLPDAVDRYETVCNMYPCQCVASLQWKLIPVHIM